MIKKLFTVAIMLSSCAYVQYQNLPSVFKELAFGVDDIVISRDFYASQPYSFAKVNIGKSGVSIFVLSKVNADNEFTWISADNERLITKNGRIIALYSEKQFSFNYINKRVFSDFGSKNKLEYLLELEHPPAIFSQEASLEIGSTWDEIKRFDESIKTKLVLEAVATQKLRWNYINQYWYDADGRIVQSSQLLHPNLQRIRIEYYFKY